MAISVDSGYLAYSLCRSALVIIFLDVALYLKDEDDLTTICPRPLPVDLRPFDL